MILVKGGTRRQRNVVYDIASFCYMELIPLIRKCYIEINIKNMKGFEGTCVDYDEREYFIDVNRKQSLEDLCVTICHEMVHVKQYIRNQLRCEDINYKTYEEYINLPWEKEAYEKQEVLYNKWKLNKVGITTNCQNLKFTGKT